MKMVKMGHPIRMKIVLCLLLSVRLTLSDVLLKDFSTADSCYRNFAGSMMTCHGTLPRFSNESFVQLSQVEQLDVLQCHFNDVTKTAFQGMLGLRSILINCGNALDQLNFAGNTLEDLKLLRLLSLNQNNIRALPPNFICQAPALQFLFLWKNSLTSVDNIGLTPSMCNSSEILLGCGQAIKTIVLKNNFIEHLPNFMMCSLPNITRLDLGQNKISRIDQNAFFHLQSLLDLDLSENNLTLIPEEVGKSLKNMIILNLSYNTLLQNVTSILKHLNRLQRLNMTSTGSAVRDGMKSDSLRFERNILILVLDENGISEMNDTLFEPIAEEDLNDSCRGFSMIAFYTLLTDAAAPLTVMAQNIAYGDTDAITGLRYLSLDSNEFDKVPSALKVLRKLQMLFLRRNRIQALKDDDFQAMRFLHILHLSFNNIQNISGKVFNNLECLVQLNLDNNAIANINSTAFDKNIGLLALYLQNNKISSIERMFYHNVNLRTLDLSYNLLTTVSIDSFPLRLSNLSLSHNNLMLMSPSRYSFPVHLGMSVLDLSHNYLTYVNKSMFPISVFLLYLNDNRISSVGNCTFCAMGRMKELRLNNNLLASPRPDWFRINSRDLNLVANVYIQGNDFVCDCTMKTFSNAILRNQLAISKIDEFEALRCQPEFYKGQRANVSIFSQRSPEDFLCRSNHTLNASLPEHCNIYHDLAWDLIIGDCNNANLGSVPNSMPSNVLYLYFDGNNITKIDRTTFNRTVNIQKLFLNNSRILEIESNAFKSLVNLQILHLQNNLLHVISEDTFSGLPKLTELYLFSNHIFYAEQRAFLSLVSLKSLLLNDNQLTDFPVWELAHLDNLTEITLSSNPWSCECDYLQKYREWLQNSAPRVQDVKTLFCNYGDNSTSAIPLIAYNGSNCYSGLNFLDSKYFPLTTCLSTLALLIFVTSALVFTYREEIRVVVYYRYGLRLFSKDGGDQDGDENKVYDAFVCYSHDDEVFVGEQLIPGLEGIDPPFRICVHSRDFVIGSFITDNILEAVEKSRRTILILSENFMRSEWCRFEFKTAHLQMFRDPSHRVILIVRGAIPENLHPEMKVYLKTNTYLMWDDRLFWKRLHYAMPDRKANSSHL